MEGGERKEKEKREEESSIKVSWLFSLSPFVFYLFAHLVQAGAACPGRFGSGGDGKGETVNGLCGLLPAGRVR